MGGKWSEKKQSPRASWTLFFSEPFLPHVWDSVFFRPLKIISSLLSVPEIFQHQGSGNSLGGLKAACIGPALSKFRRSAGDGAT